MPPITETTAMRTTPSSTSTLPKAGLAFPVLPVVVALPVVPVVPAAVGVKTALGLEMHELASASAVEVLEEGLTVPLPAKLHD